MSQFLNADGTPVIVTSPGDLAQTPTLTTFGGFNPMAKYDKTGTYQDAEGNYFIGHAGDANPQDLTYVGPLDTTVDDEAVPANEQKALDDQKAADAAAQAEADASAKLIADQRSGGTAPENRKEAGAPENRKAK
ncbi:MAG: hypothetical protein M3Q82_04015 [Actinomycetota bacterium]|nr:hypothetical protein [Actinomycetota bacterium]